MTNKASTDKYSGKHLILLSGPMGSGHIRAAEAIRTWAEEEYPDLKVTHINVSDYFSYFVKKIYDNYYIKLINTFPSVWRYVYKKTDTPPSKSKIDIFLKWVRKKTGRKMVKQLKKLEGDFIICTHFLPAEMLDPLKKCGEITIPVSSVITDFDLHWIYVRPHLDHFFVASEEVAFCLSQRGISKEKIHLTGIPIFPAFSKKYDQEKLREEFWLRHDKLTFLMMTGGAGVGSIDKIASYLLANSNDIQIIGMAGKNKEILSSLQKLAAKYPNRILPVAFTKKMAQYLAACDIVVTKPGGISVSESIAMGKPVIIMNPIAGHEERNSDYLLEESVALKAYDEASLLHKYKVFLRESKQLEFMREAVSKIRKPKAGLEILKIAIGDINENK